MGKPKRRTLHHQGLNKLFKAFKTPALPKTNAKSHDGITHQGCPGPVTQPCHSLDLPLPLVASQVPAVVNHSPSLHHQHLTSVFAKQRLCCFRAFLPVQALRDHTHIYLTRKTRSVPWGYSNTSDATSYANTTSKYLLQPTSQNSTRFCRHFKRRSFTRQTTKGLHRKLSSAVKHQVVSTPFTRGDGSSLPSQLCNTATPQPNHTRARNLSHWERPWKFFRGFTYKNKHQRSRGKPMNSNPALWWVTQWTHGLHDKVQERRGKRTESLLIRRMWRWPAISQALNGRWNSPAVPSLGWMLLITKATLSPHLPGAADSTEALSYHNTRVTKEYRQEKNKRGSFQKKQP